MLSQTLDRPVPERFFYLLALKERKGKKFSLLCHTLPGKAVTTYIPKFLQIHRFRAFLHDTSLYVADNLRAVRVEFAPRDRFGTRFA